MQFVRADKSEASMAIAMAIGKALSRGERVLWLVSGGSNIDSEVAVMKALKHSHNDRLGGLAILPMDERYGQQGHADSNIAKLQQAGFEQGAATLVDVFTHNVSFEQTVQFYGEVATAAITNAQYIIGQFGIGTDGHTAGLLPNSPALSVEGSAVAGYEWSDYRRITLTVAALQHCTAAYVLAYGTDKLVALKKLAQSKASLATLPAQVLRDIPEVYVYNDAIESEG